MLINKRIEELIDKKLAKKEEIGFDQVIKHIERAHKDLIVAKANLEIDEETAYNSAYLAMLRTARALMFSQGYRPIDGSQHKTVIDFAGIVLGEEFKKLVNRLDGMRKTRNEFTYNPGVPISPTEAKESIKLGREWVKQVSSFIQEKNPQLNLFTE